MGEVEIPPGTAFTGINSMVKHSVGGAEYGDVRIGAFIGKRIINRVRTRSGKTAIDYLTELSTDSFEGNYQDSLPERIIGSEFLTEYKSHGDPVTQIQPDAK